MSQTKPTVRGKWGVACGISGIVAGIALAWLFETYLHQPNTTRNFDIVLSQPYCRTFTLFGVETTPTTDDGARPSDGLFWAGPKREGLIFLNHDPHAPTTIRFWALEGENRALTLLEMRSLTTGTFPVAQDTIGFQNYEIRGGEDCPHLGATPPRDLFDRLKHSPM